MICLFFRFFVYNYNYYNHCLSMAHISVPPPATRAAVVAIKPIFCTDDSSGNNSGRLLYLRVEYAERRKIFSIIFNVNVSLFFEYP